MHRLEGYDAELWARNQGGCPICGTETRCDVHPFDWTDCLYTISSTSLPGREYYGSSRCLPNRVYEHSSHPTQGSAVIVNHCDDWILKITDVFQDSDMTKGEVDKLLRRREQKRLDSCGGMCLNINVASRYQHWLNRRKRVGHPAPETAEEKKAVDWWTTIGRDAYNEYHRNYRQQNRAKIRGIKRRYEEQERVKEANRKRAKKNYDKKLTMKFAQASEE